MNDLSISPQATIRVSARSLFPYIAFPGLSYDQWTQHLITRHPFDSLCESEFEDHLSKKPGGEYFLSLKYASFCLYTNIADIIGALGVMLMSEALEGKHGEGPDSVNRALDSCGHIARNFGMIGARHLQQVLGIEMDHEQWIAALKSKSMMRPGVHFKWFKPKKGERIMVFTPPFAKAVACQTQTPRGIFIKAYCEREEKERMIRNLR